VKLKNFRLLSQVIAINVCFFFILLSGTAFAVAPIMFYSDLTSGPTIGGQDNKGVFVTIWGKNFGSAQGNSYVTIGGGQADNYPEWSDTKVCFQLGVKAAIGDIVLNTAEGKSNGIPFSVRSGNVYFITPDGAGDGSYSNPFSPFDFISKLAAGEDGVTGYFRAGTYDKQYAHIRWHSNFCLEQIHSGVSGMENAFVAYPGENPLIHTSDSTGADRSNFRKYNDGLGYIVISKLHCWSKTRSIQAASNYRIIGNHIEGMHEFGATGSISINTEESDVKIYGNEITGGSSHSKLDHAFYPGSGCDNVDFGWNWIHDNDFEAGPMISVNSNDAWNQGYVSENMHIHDNIIDMSTYPSRAMGVFETGQGTEIYYYNNIIIGPSFNSAFAIYAASGNVYYYNNTVYNCGADNTYSVFGFYDITVYEHHYQPESITLKNNIIYASSHSDNYIKCWGITTVPVQDSNLYYGIGSYADHSTGCTEESLNSVEEDPIFINAAGKDFSLQSTSLCKKAGTLTVSAVVKTDINGISRPQGGVYDIGAYEYNGSPDNENPAITITSPTTAPKYETLLATISLAGTASDNVEVQSVTWTQNGGQPQDATGTTDWSIASVTLVEGANNIVLTARDRSGNPASDTIVINHTKNEGEEPPPPPPPDDDPAITITSPTTAPEYETLLATISLAGTASDNVEVQSVTWTQNGGQPQDATGTTDWSIASVTLVEGANNIVLTARDTSGNPASDTIGINYTKSQVTYREIFGDVPASDHPGTLQDTFNNANPSNQNYSTSTASLSTYTWPTDSVANRVVMKWDLSAIPSNATIHSAALHLYMYEHEESADDTYDVSVHKIVNRNPVIAACTWNTYDGVNAWTGGADGGAQDMATAEDAKSIDKTYGYKTWTVTNMVQDWVRNPSSNLGMILDSDSSAPKNHYRHFRPTEYGNSDQRPKLTVIYSESSLQISPPENLKVVFH